MNILIIGSGGREHAIAWKLKQSKNAGAIFIAPGNAGTKTIGTNLDIKPNQFNELKQAIIDNNIEMLVVGPEEPLVNGIVDFFQSCSDLKKLHIIGPCGKAAQLEGSKEFAKNFMERNGIPTARYQGFTKEQLTTACTFLDTLLAPYVLKADGLAAGKGVMILNDLAETKKELAAMLDGKFGKASQKVVIEEFLSGIELSVFVITDGENYKILPEAKDYKRIGEGDTGLNTGGMGAISPVPFADKAFMQKIEKQIIIPTITGLKKENIPYQGFIFFGLIKVGENPYVIEYNVRMGDPETEVVMPRIKSDLLDLFISCGEKTLETHELIIDPQPCSTVILASAGYPGDYQTGKPISIGKTNDDVMVFHAGTKSDGQQTITSGGRVLAVSAIAPSFGDALDKSYEAITHIDFEGKTFRKDIGFDFEIKK